MGLFGDLIPSTRENGSKNKDVFDITSLGDSLPDTKKEKKDSKSPETFLGPNASSLVNLDSLVIAPQNLKTRNPFLAGRSYWQKISIANCSGANGRPSVSLLVSILY